MKKLNLLISFFLLTCFYVHAQEGEITLTVNVTNIKDLSGYVRVCLVQESSEYLSSQCNLGKSVEASSKEVQLVFNNLPKGQYAITLFHDVDNNNKLNTNGMFGMPSEPYGFSNNPGTWFGPPKYEKCVFELSKDRSVKIKL